MNKRKKTLIIILVSLLLLISGWLIYRYYFQKTPEPVTLVSGEFFQMEKMRNESQKKSC